MKIHLSSNPQFKYSLFCVIFSFLFFIGFVLAQESNIKFPISELGNCESKEECKQYCDKPENRLVCVDFAQKHGLMSSEEADKVKKLADIKTGPGGCSGQKECEVYCNNTDHIDICIEFGEKHNLMSKEEAEEGRKVAQALKNGAKLPGECKNKSECQTYCENPDHSEECMDFAVKAGFIPKEEAEHGKKMASLIKSGQTPGGCKNKDECESYCHNQDHFKECSEFAEKSGFASKEEIENFKKTGGQKPGNCQTSKECREFCNNPSNQETCLKFAQEHDLIEGGKIEEIRKGTEHLRQNFTNIPSEAADCIKSAIGDDKFQQIVNGEIVPGPELGQSMRQCFESFGKNHGKERGNQNGNINENKQEPPGNIKGGPGGCSSPTECRKYCSEHEDECRAMFIHSQPQPSMSNMPPRPQESGGGDWENHPQPSMPMPPSDGHSDQGMDRYKEEMMRRDKMLENQPRPSYHPEFSPHPMESYKPMESYRPPMEGYKPMENMINQPMGSFQPQMPNSREEGQYKPMYQQPSGNEYQMPPPGATGGFGGGMMQQPPPSGPSSLVQNKFLGAIVRFLVGN